METAQSSEGSEEGVNFQKIALIIFGLFLLIVLLEGAYFVYTNYFSESNPAQPALPQTTIEESPLPLSGANKMNLEKGENYLGYLREIEKSKISEFVVAARFNIIISGRIVENKNIDEIREDIHYVYLIKLDKDAKTLVYKLSQGEFDSLKTYLISEAGAEKNPININDVKPGDFAILKIDLDFLDTSAIGERTLEITKTSP